MEVGHMVLRNFADEIIALTDDYEELEKENAELRDSRKRWHDMFLKAMRERNALESDNHDLRAGRAAWPSDHSGETVPRVISADEVKPEQIIAYWQKGVRPDPFGSVAHVRTVEREDDESYRVTDARGEFDILGGEDDDCTIILLEEAPDSDDGEELIYGTKLNVDFIEKLNASSVQMSHYPEPANQLTVHALEDAPVGSVLRTKDGMVLSEKHSDNRWYDYDDEDGVETRPQRLIKYDADLHHPEPDDPFKKLFSAVFKAKKLERERGERIVKAWRDAHAETFGSDHE